MSDTALPLRPRTREEEPPSPPPPPKKEANGAGSLTVAAAAVIVLNFIVKTKWAVEIPGDVGMSIGVLLTAIAHGAQMAFLAWRNKE